MTSPAVLMATPVVIPATAQRDRSWVALLLWWAATESTAGIAKGKEISVYKLLTSWQVEDNIPEYHKELTCSGL